MTQPLPPAAPCPCGGGRYATCCGPLHAGKAAASAGQLMRSRYSAYALELGEYLLATWHASTRPQQPVHFEPGLRWLGLEVKNERTGERTGERSIDAEHATVSFVARSKLGGRAHRLVENSRFVREGGRWFYVDGDVVT